MEQQQQTEQPVIFHITHWKAGSQWVRGVLSEAQPDRVIEVKDDMSHVSKDPIVQGGLYSPVYIARPSFESLINPAVNKRVFVVIRDLRDTLISWYFSMKVSHSTNVKGVAPLREQLVEREIEDGLKFLIREKLVAIARIQRTWIESSIPVFRYEELLNDELTTFKKIFSHCEIDLSEDDSEALIQKHTFERRSGRKPGQEDVKSHYRKAIVGDWKTHFNDSVKHLFKEKFGLVLINTGYEDDFSW